MAVRPGVLAILLLLPGAACDAALGIQDLPRSHAETRYEAPACGSCVDVSCAAAREACRADATCDALDECVAKCRPNHARCRMDCETISPVAAASPAFLALDHCVRTSCMEPCLGVGGLETIFKGCSCLAGECAAESLACVRAGTASRPGGCERRLACIARDGLDSDNVERCLQKDYVVEPEVGALRSCYRAITCKDCPLANDGDFDCVDKYAWTPTRAATVELRLHLTTFDETRSPASGVTATVCHNGACDTCPQVLDSQPTDDDGVVTLTVPTGLGGFGGCIRFDKPGLVPMILQGGRPLVRDARGEMFVVKDTNLPLLGALVGGVTVLPDRGHLVVIESDCINMPVKGVRLAVSPSSPETRSGYYVGSRVDMTATGTGVLGTALFVNVPVGDPLSTITGFLGDREVSRSRAQIVPGTITVVLAFPRAAQ